MQLGEESLFGFLFYILVPYWGKSMQEFKSGTWQQKQKQKPQSHDIDWFSPHDMLKLLFYTT